MYKCSGFLGQIQRTGVKVVKGIENSGFRRAEVMSHTEIGRISENIGDCLSKASKEEPLTIKKIREIVGKIKNIKKYGISITDDPEILKKTLRNAGYDENTANLVANSIQALSLPNAETGRILVFIPTEKLKDPIKIMNATSHEIKHSLTQIFSLQAKIDKITKKFISEQKIKKIINEYSTLSMNFQQRIFTLFGVDAMQVAKIEAPATEKGLSQFLGAAPKKLEINMRKEVREFLSNDDFKKNIKNLKVLRSVLAEEMRAYSVGGNVVARHCAINQETASAPSQMTAAMLKEQIKAINKELKIQRLRRLKAFFGIKNPPINTGNASRPYPTGYHANKTCAIQKGPHS